MCGGHNLKNVSSLVMFPSLFLHVAVIAASRGGTYLLRHLVVCGVICGHDNVHRQYWCWWYRLVGCIVVLSVDVAMYTVAKKYIIVLDGGEN